jgi:hypothetical protein
MNREKEGIGELKKRLEQKNAGFCNSLLYKELAVITGD